MVKAQMTYVYAIKEELEAKEKQYPLGRFGEPEGIDHDSVFLLSDASKWIKGSVLTIDGGITLR